MWLVSILLIIKSDIVSDKGQKTMSEYHSIIVIFWEWNIFFILFYSEVV